MLPDLIVATSLVAQVGERLVWGAILNFVAGLLAATGGAIFFYVSYADSNPWVPTGAAIMLLSGIVWTISGIIGLRK
jgi:hypothetical protein